MEGESATQAEEKHGKEHKTRKSHKTRNRIHCANDATFSPDNHECEEEENWMARSVKEPVSHNLDEAGGELPDHKEGIRHHTQEGDPAQKLTVPDPKARLLLTKEPVFIQVKPKSKEEHTPALLQKPYGRVRNPARQLLPCIIIAQKSKSQTGPEAIQEFPKMYPDYKVQFDCRLAKAQIALAKTNALHKRHKECDFKPSSGVTIPKEFFDEQAKGDGPKMKGHPGFILDTSTTPFAVRPWISKDTRQEYNKDSKPDTLRQVSRVEEISPPTFVVERVEIDDAGPKRKAPFKKRQAWKTPPGTSTEIETANVEPRIEESVTTALVTAAEEHYTIVDGPAGVEDEVYASREIERSESSDSDNWENVDEDKQEQKTIVKSTDAKTSPADPDETDRIDKMNAAIAHFKMVGMSCEVKDSDELRKLFLYPNPLNLPVINQTVITEISPSPKYYSIGKFDNGEPKYIVNKHQVSEELAEFVMLPIPIGFLIQCTIRRDNKGVERGLFPTYYLYLEYGDGRRIFLLSARKRKKSATSNYIICTDQVTLTEETMVGKLRSNLLGTQFNIFDSGKTPNSKAFLDRAHEASREELGTVSYEYNLFGLRGPRKFNLLVPALVSDHQRLTHRPSNDSDNLIGKLTTDIGSVIRLKNRAPIWHEEYQSYVLNFHGRVNAASVKNFQLVHEEKEDYTILQFGRAGADDGLFTLDFRYPLCPLQAFALALTSFDNKIACE